MLMAWLSPAPWRPEHGLTPYHLPTNPGGAACKWRVPLSPARLPFPIYCCKGFIWLQAPAHGMSPVWDKNMVSSPPPACCPSVSVGPLMRTPPHILLLKVRHSTGWEVPHSCELVSPPHPPELSQAPGTAGLARGGPSSARAAPLPGHCWPRGDRAEAEGISLRHSPLLQTHTRAAKPHSPAKAPAVPHPPGSIPPIPPGCSTGSTMRQPGQALHEEEGEKRFLRHH